MPNIRIMPLAVRLRPKTIDEIVGQEHLLSKDAKLRKLIESDILTSIVLFGPAGTGKTTIAEVIALYTKSEFVRLNATQATVKDIRKYGSDAEKTGNHVVLFIDECLPYNTLIYCKVDGIKRNLPIGYIVEKQLKCAVLSYNHATNKQEWRKISGWMVRPPRPMIEIKIGNNDKESLLRCSEDHQIHTKNRGYVAAKDLMSGDELTDSKIGFIPTVLSIRKLSIEETLYDLEVEDNHNFFADGVLVHNCHRFSKTQQDVLLPFVENGHIIFIGATTENVFHSLNPSLLSRVQMVCELEHLEPKHLAQVLKRGVDYYKQETPIHINQAAAKHIINVANGDARKVLSILEVAMAVADDNNITLELVRAVSPSKYMVMDTQSHYNMASATQGALQASDPDAAIYWLAKWLESGEDPRYIARRLMVSASEDAAGNPEAIATAHAAYTSACVIGRPECDIILAHAAILVATAPRNKSAACAVWSAVKDVRDGVNIEVPKEMRDCHYSGAKELGHGSYHDGMSMEDYVGISKIYYKPEKWCND